MNPGQVKIGTFTTPSFSSSSKTVDLPIGFHPDWIKIVKLEASLSNDEIIGLEWTTAWNGTKKIVKIMGAASAAHGITRDYVASSSSYYLENLTSQTVSQSSSASFSTVQHIGELGIRLPNATAKNLKAKSFYYIAHKADKFEAHGTLVAA